MPATLDIEVCDVTTVDPERVKRVRGALSTEFTLDRLAELFSALSDPTRLRIVEALAIEELCVCDLSAALNLSQSSVSHHLRTLRALRLVRHRRAGRLVYYALDDLHVNEIFAQGQDHVREGH